MTFCTPEAAIGGETARDILFIKQVVNVKRYGRTWQVEACQIILDHGIPHGVVRHFEGVGFVTIG
ncbi:hypothetical protein D3C71_1980380 [compost metagenome]